MLSHTGGWNSGVGWVPRGLQVNHICSCLCQEPILSQVRYIDNLELVFVTTVKQSPACTSFSLPKECKAFWQQSSSCQLCGVAVPRVDEPLLTWSRIWRIRLWLSHPTMTDEGRGSIFLGADQQKNTSKFSSWMCFCMLCSWASFAPFSWRGNGKGGWRDELGPGWGLDMWG